MVSKEEVLRIAKLARLRIPESEIDGIRRKFSAILDHFKFLDEIDTTGVEPQFHAAEKMELRGDDPEPPLDREMLMRNAPDQFENCFRIPRVVGGEEG